MDEKKNLTEVERKELKENEISTEELDSVAGGINENKTNTGKWVCPKCGEVEYKSEYYVPMVGQCCPTCEGLLEYKEGC